MADVKKVTVEYDDGTVVDITDNVVVIHANEDADGSITADWEVVRMPQDTLVDALQTVRDCELTGEYNTFDYLGE